MSGRESLFEIRFWRHPVQFVTRRWRENWAQTWTLGPLSFEVEWVALARQYVFALTIDRSGGRYD